MLMTVRYIIKSQNLQFAHLFFFVKVRNEFYKDTQGVILVYDVGQKDSFDALDAWLAEMKQDLGPHGNMENIVFAVCANKVTALDIICSTFQIHYGKSAALSFGEQMKKKKKKSLFYTIGINRFSKHTSLKQRIKTQIPICWGIYPFFSGAIHGEGY